MNRTGIEWADRTWNPITGCTNDCRDPRGRPYCYAQKLAEGRLAHKYPNGFQPTFWLDRRNQVTPRQKPQIVFTGSMGDMWAGRTKFWEYMRRDIWITMEQASQHAYVVLTKLPSKMIRSDAVDLVGAGAWVGVSVEDQAPLDRVQELVSRFDSPRRVVSFEPMFGPIEIPPQLLLELDWIIVGGCTGIKNPVLPRAEWVADLCLQAMAAGVAIFIKDNLIPVIATKFDDDEAAAWVRRWQQWPEDMLEHLGRTERRPTGGRPTDGNGRAPLGQV